MKLMQIDKTLSAYKAYPAETRFNYSGRYTLLYPVKNCRRGVDDLLAFIADIGIRDERIHI